MDRLKGRALNEHERYIAEFMAQAKADSPSLYVEVGDRHAVLTEQELKRRREQEVPLEALD